MNMATGMVVMTIGKPQVAIMSDNVLSLWWAKLCLVTGLLLLSILVVTKGISAAIERDNPSLALRLDRTNATAAWRLAERLVPPGSRNADLSRAKALARISLQIDPTSGQAAGILGLIANIEGNHNVANRLFRYSNESSRRYLPTQLWLIEVAVEHNRVAEALRHYDFALRTSRRAGPILIPILIAALEDDTLVHPLARVLATRPPWGGAFLYQLASTGEPKENISSFFRRLTNDQKLYDTRNADLFINRAVAEGDPRSAWLLYRALEPKRSVLALRSSEFSPVSARDVPFEWQFIDEPDLSARLDERKGVLNVETRDGSEGRVARQLVRLSAGRHEISARAAKYATAGPLAIATVNVSCNNTTVPLASSRVATGAGSAPITGVSFEVPGAGCDFQWVDVLVGQTVNESTGHLSIDDIVLN